MQEEETESARAVQQLRRRARNGKSGLFPISPISIEDPDRGEEGARNNEADGVELPLVVHRLEKTYPPPILQRCFYCLYPLSRSRILPFCCCCKRPQPTKALKGVSFCVPRGSCFAYIGGKGIRAATSTDCSNPTSPFIYLCAV